MQSDVSVSEYIRDVSASNMKVYSSHVSVKTEFTEYSLQHGPDESKMTLKGETS